jgi:hypothetical protein
VKRTPARGVKQYLKPRAYKQLEGYAPVRGGMPDIVPIE